MLPKWHIFWGIAFALLLWAVSPEIKFIYLVLVFLSSVLIDIDHYITAVVKTKKWSISYAYNYYKALIEKEKKRKSQGVMVKGDFHIFHTIELHILTGILSILWTPFFYIFIGMVFHSILDIIWMVYHDLFYSREFFFFNWLRRILFK